MCSQHEETVHHIVSGCEALAKTEYISRHNNAAAYLHWSQPRSQVLSPTRRETLVGSGHVSPRIWEITNELLGGGADKCEVCLYKA